MMQQCHAFLTSTRALYVAVTLLPCLVFGAVGCKSTNSGSSTKNYAVANGGSASNALGNTDLSSNGDGVINPDNFPSIPLHGDIDKNAYGKVIGADNLERKSALEGQLVAASEGRAASTATDQSYALSGPTKAKQTHGPAISNDSDCPGLIGALDIVNKVMNAGGKCNAWFDQHGPVTGPFKVVKSTYKAACLSQAPTWTYPYINRIGFCSWACSKSPAEVSSLLIHEIGHHYCPSFIGRETCAISAQTACENEL